jgi:hypothetical protein
MRLPLGGSGNTHAVALFLDLRRFTARSFWDSPEEILLVNVAVISELATAVEQHGGHVLGFRGDGVFACFDAGQQDPRIAAALAVGTAAWALDAVKNAVNQLLEVSNIQPVQVRAGLDYGRLDFVRIGSEAGSEVNVLGFAANFAAKCEKAAKSWADCSGRRSRRTSSRGRRHTPSAPTSDLHPSRANGDPPLLCRLAGSIPAAHDARVGAVERASSLGGQHLVTTHPVRRAGAARDLPEEINMTIPTLLRHIGVTVPAIRDSRWPDRDGPAGIADVISSNGRAASPVPRRG